MNTTTACSEPFARYFEFHAAFDQQFKISVAAVNDLRSRVAAASPLGADLLREVLNATEEPWRRDQDWPEPKEFLDAAYRNVCLLGLVQLHSALDDLMVSVEAERSRWSVRLDLRAPKAPSQDPGIEDLEKLSERCYWSTVEFDAWRPVLLLFRVLRNCVAHRSAHTSEHAAALASDDSLRVALTHWPQREGANPPPIPPLVAHVPLSLLPRHVILALDAAYRAVSHMSACFTMELGPRGILLQAIHHTLLADKPTVYTNAYRTPEAVINRALVARYYVQEISAEGTVAKLKEANLWNECLRRHKVVYGDPPQPRREGAEGAG